MGNGIKNIFLDRWLAFHPYKKPGPSDYYYLGLANRLWKIIDSQKHDYLVSLLEEEEEKDNLCCCLACYLEDILSEAGIWQAFTRQHRELYGKNLPFYKTVDYYHDEINPEDIYFLLWHFFSKALYDEMIISPFVDNGVIYNDEDTDFVKIVNQICEVEKLEGNYTKALPYTTDGAVLQPFFNNVPTIILGPGQPEQAHQTDEFCYTKDIIESVKIYKIIIFEWSEHIV